MDPVPHPLLLRKSGRGGNRTRTSGSVARNSGLWTTEAIVKKIYVYLFIYLIFCSVKGSPRIIAPVGGEMIYFRPAVFNVTILFNFIPPKLLVSGCPVANPKLGPEHSVVITR
jgi:hypothetical protein